MFEYFWLICGFWWNRPIDSLVVFQRGDERSHLMITRIARGALALTLLGSVTLLGTPTFAIEPDVDSPAGPELPAGVRSVAFRLVFRAPDRTLRDAEVDQTETRLLTALEDELGVRRRGAGATRGGER